MSNIASVNMPKIKPETKVLIKNLKSKSPAEVADIFNVSKRQVERIHKRYQETGDIHDRRADRARQLLEMTACWSASQFRQELYVGFLLPMVPQSYCCPETSTKQETAKRPCCVRQGPQPDGRLDSRKLDFSDESSVELHPKPRQYCRQSAGARLEPRFTQKTVKFGGGKIMV